jgi:hypothetical protein
MAPPFIPARAQRMRPFGFTDDQLKDSKLAALFRYWQEMKRGQADIPFADDVRLMPLAESDAAMLIDVIEKPVRFRFAIAGEEIRKAYGDDIAGLLADDMTVRKPFEFFLSQCSATVEGRAPTLFRGESYARLLLPLWGDGHINMLLGGISETTQRR